MSSGRPSVVPRLLLGLVLLVAAACALGGCQWRVGNSPWGSIGGSTCSSANPCDKVE